MNQAVVDRIVNAVLYEGYVLYPYRPSVKNRQRWTFGGLCPPAYCQAHASGDTWAMQTECLVEGDAQSRLQVQVRFLHLLARLVGEVNPPLATCPEGEEPAFRVVETLKVGQQLLHTWQEAVEREVNLGEVNVLALAGQPHQQKFSFTPMRQLECVRDETNAIAGVVVRQQQAITGRIVLSAEQIETNLFKVRVRIENCTALEDAAQKSRDEALLYGLVSTHTILGVQAGEFLSLLDPPAQWQEVARSCQNVGTWPVLVGEIGETDTMLSSPIILYDYPQIAPESPGDLFDGTEIDEILALRILTLTDEEKQAAAAVDERTRAMLSRTEALARDQLLKLHGTVRGLRPLPEESRHD
jgi:hydrogenase maturation protease